MDFNILEARSFVASSYCNTTRLIKDYEIDMECESGRIYSYGDICERRLVSGDIIVKKPQGIAKSEGIQNSYMLTLDFSKKNFSDTYSRTIPGDIQPLCENDLILRLEPLIHPSHPDEFERIFNRLFSLADKNNPASKELVMELLYLLNAEISKKNYEMLKPRESVSDTVVSFMRDNLQRNITLDDISKYLHREKSYLSRLFRKETGKSPIDTLIEMRLERASDLITTTDLNIYEIASECGYNTVSFFISSYKKRFGLTPEAHRKLILEKK